MSPEREEILVDAFYRAALFLRRRVEKRGWKWTSNFLREYVRAETHQKFTNSLSPKMLRRLVKEHPELSKFVKIKPLKGGKCL